MPQMVLKPVKLGAVGEGVHLGCILPVENSILEAVQGLAHKVLVAPACLCYILKYKVQHKPKAAPRILKCLGGSLAPWGVLAL